MIDKIEMTPEVLEKLEEYHEHLKVIHNGEFLFFLNPSLALLNGLENEDLDKITALHDELQTLFDEMKEVSDPRELPAYVDKVEDIEFRMQDAWKFKDGRDATKHSWWYRVPQCECPFTDNQEIWGTARRIISEKCPVHGALLKAKKEDLKK